MNKKEITLPWNFIPRSYQIELLAAPQRFKIAVWHRRCGKSRVAFNQQVMRAVVKKGVYYYVLPTYRQAKQVAWDSLVKDHVPESIVDRLNESELTIYYKNGSIQRFIGGDDPDKHRGTNPIDVVFDEYSECKEELWTAIFKPVLEENGGTATFIFTPKGKNHSYRLLQTAKQNPDKWFTSVKTVNDTKSFQVEQLAEIQSSTPVAIYEQEYLCQFADSGTSVFRNVRNNVYPTNVNLPMEGEFKLGVDLAKYNDWTVITPFNVNTKFVYPIDRFNQVDWSLQKARIQTAVYKFNNARVTIDSTGLGDPIVEDLRIMGVDISEKDAFKFTEKSRNDLLNNLALLLEQNRIKIPNDEVLIKELESFVFQANESGKVKMESTEAHDDTVMSLALAVWGLDLSNKPIDFIQPRIKLNRHSPPAWR